MFRKKKINESDVDSCNSNVEEADELFATVLKEVDALDRIFTDFRLTGGAYEYYFKEVNVNGEDIRLSV